MGAWWIRGGGEAIAGIANVFRKHARGAPGDRAPHFFVTVYSHAMMSAPLTSLSVFISKYKWLWVAYILCLCVLVLPEIYSAGLKLPPPGHRQVLLSFLFLAGLCVFAIANLWGFLCVIGIICLQWADVIHFRYFGSYFTRRDFPLLIEEFSDIVSGLLGTTEVWLGSVEGIIACLVILLVSRRLVAWGRGASLTAALLLVLSPVGMAAAKEKWRMEPDDRRPALINALYSFGGFFADQIHPSVGVTDTGVRYSVNWREPQPSVKPSILLIVGESLSAAHMGVLGYDRTTTPHLAELLEKYGGRASKMVSAGVSTRVSIPMFMNVVREPGNAIALRSSPANLFRVAKHAGYQTAFLSVQDMSGVSSSIGREAIDHWMDAVDQPIRNNVPDAMLLSRVRQSGLDLRKPYFMVLNTRSTHLPYEANYPPAFAKFSGGAEVAADRRHIDDYDDAMRWFDEKVSSAIEYVLHESAGPVVVLMVSDHGEMVGEQGRFGHNVIHPSVYTTPFVWMTNDRRAVSDVFDRCVLNHYELGKRIVNLLGGVVVNPLERDGDKTYWVNGTSLDGGNGVMKYDYTQFASVAGCEG